jgi:hypothetical protein
MRCKPSNDAPCNLKGAYLGVNSHSFLIKDFNSTGKSRDMRLGYLAKDYQMTFQTKKATVGKHDGFRKAFKNYTYHFTRLKPQYKQLFSTSLMGGAYE